MREGVPRLHGEITPIRIEGRRGERRRRFAPVAPRQPHHAAEKTLLRPPAQQHAPSAVAGDVGPPVARRLLLLRRFTRQARGRRRRDGRRRDRTTDTRRKRDSWVCTPWRPNPSLLGRSRQTDASASARQRRRESLLLQTGNGVSMRRSRAMTRSTLPSTTVAGRSKGDRGDRRRGVEADALATCATPLHLLGSVHQTHPATCRAHLCRLRARA